VFHGLGGRVAGAILILFGLAALAPACYSAWVFCWRLWAHWPRIRRVYWTWWIGGGLAFVLIASSWASGLETIYRVMGLVCAPAVGAIVGDFVRQKGGWSGIREGVNPAGMLAWAAGCGVQPVVALGLMAAAKVPRWLPPAPITGFVTAAI